ncbi:unnamed protein product [Closterium sp. NIES-54]
MPGSGGTHSTSTSLTPSVPLTKLLKGGGLKTALLLLALTTTGATPLCNAATRSTTASAASATSSSFATTAAATAATASTAAADTSTTTTTPTTTPTPSTASTTTSTAPATPTSAPAPLTPASAATPARGRRSTNRLETTKVGRSSRSNRGQEGGGGTPLKDRGSGDAAEKRNEPPPSKIEALDGSNCEEWSGRMRSAFKCYKLLKLAMGEEKMPEEGNARDRWIEKSAVLYDLILQSVNNDMFQHIKDLVELDDSGPKAWKLLRDVIQPNTLPMVIVLEKELAALSMRPGDDVKPVLDKIKDTYARMAAAGSNVSQMQQCTKIISVLDNSWDNLIPTLNTQQDQWTPEWLRQQILQEDFRRRHTGGGAANKTVEGLGTRVLLGPLSCKPVGGGGFFW